MCDPGFADCNGDKQVDGCEVNLKTDPNNCNGCGLGHVCSANHITTPSCTNGACDGMCDAGFADCNNDKLSDGCEINTNTDANNCGGCGMAFACAVGACVGGHCQCADGMQNGGETDVDCGGLSCAKCADGLKCLVPGDCQSGTCNGSNVCGP
jgi:hypothetical protein